MNPWIPWYLIAAFQRLLPQLQLQLAGGCVEVAADHGGLQLLLRLLIVLQLNPALLQVPGGEEDEGKARFHVLGSVANFSGRKVTIGCLT